MGTLRLGGEGGGRERKAAAGASGFARLTRRNDVLTGIAPL